MAEQGEKYRAGRVPTDKPVNINPALRYGVLTVYKGSKTFAKVTRFVCKLLKIRSHLQPLFFSGQSWRSWREHWKPTGQKLEWPKFRRTFNWLDSNSTWRRNCRSKCGLDCSRRRVTTTFPQSLRRNRRNCKIALRRTCFSYNQTSFARRRTYYTVSFPTLGSWSSFNSRTCSSKSWYPVCPWNVT